MLPIRWRLVSHKTERRRWNQEYKNKHHRFLYTGTMHYFISRMRTWLACLRSQPGQSQPGQSALASFASDLFFGESRQSTSSKLWFYHFFILKWKGEVDPFSFCDDDHQREFECLTCTGFHCFSHGLPSLLKLINDLSRCCFLPWILFISFLYLLITNAVCDDIKLVLDFSSVIFQWLYCGNTVVITWEPQFWNIINKMWT